jgi:hypothetical protein
MGICLETWVVRVRCDGCAGTHLPFPPCQSFPRVSVVPSLLSPALLPFCSSFVLMCPPLLNTDDDTRQQMIQMHDGYGKNMFGIVTQPTCWTTSSHGRACIIQFLSCQFLSNHSCCFISLD